jgi:ribosome recycling factor
MEKFIFIENDTKGFEQAMTLHMNATIKHLDGELIKIRTGRAHTSLIEDIMVNAYGNNVPLKQVAALTAADVRLLTIQPWDMSIAGDIERAIKMSDIGLTPINDGKIIRLELPEMSTNRRQDLVKILHKKLEECRVAIRNIRKEFNNQMRDAKKDKEISENFFHRLADHLQKITDKFIAQAESLAEKKEKEIHSV